MQIFILLWQINLSSILLFLQCNFQLMFQQDICNGKQGYFVNERLL